MASVRLEEGSAALVVHVGGVLDIYAAKEARAALEPALSTARPRLRLELGSVEEVDLAGVQVLLWLCASASAAGLEVELGARSAAVEGAAKSLHLTALGAAS
jgi:anti-anti-sigma factor